MFILVALNGSSLTRYGIYWSNWNTSINTRIPPPLTMSKTLDYSHVNGTTWASSMSLKPW
jgi:hypothetical protein